MAKEIAQRYKISHCKQMVSYAKVQKKDILVNYLIINKELTKVLYIIIQVFVKMVCE